MEIYLIRHTTPDIPEGVCYGQTDVGVKDSFNQEVKRLQEVLPTTFNRIYHSPLQRCRLLAEAFDGQDVVVDERLKEWNFGAWEMQPWNSIPKELLTPFMEDFVNLSPPNGESFLLFHDRVNTFLEQLPYQEDTKVGIFTHGGVIRSMLCNIMEVPLHKAFHWHIDFGHYCKLQYVNMDRINLTCFNG
ncbi:alpha-ribazole phosphatase [Algivirga pacifica]|uniref:Alpha-ribazole phosphatase n=1 Tax=Algivirga pacifica TaxID=1162670 RepID=A0ABP9DHC5_9BACT